MKGSIILGAIFGFLAVALGAFGAHALEGVLDDYGVDIWEKAVKYQMFHSAGILVVGLLLHRNIFGEMKSLKWATICMSVGILFFSGSLYTLAVTGIKMLGAITPIGGCLFLVGWVLVIVATVKNSKY